MALAESTAFGLPGAAASDVVDSSAEAGITATPTVVTNARLVTLFIGIRPDVRALYYIGLRA